MRIVRHGFAVSLLIAGCVSAAWGGTVKVQAGDHGDFTRLVIAAGEKTGWSLGRTIDGYELRLIDPQARFELGQIFDKIGRGRIADIGPAERPGALGLTLGCDCHATAFAMNGGRIVIDIADGPADKTSAFEQDFGAPEGGAAASGKGGATAPSPPASDGSSPATLAFRRTAEPAPAFPPVWQNYGSAIAGRVALADLSVAAQVPPAGGFGPTTAAPSPETPRFSPHDFAIPQPSIPLAIPDPSARAAEDELLRQLSRAASQGLVTLPDPTFAKPADPAPARQSSSENARTTADGPALPDTPKVSSTPSFFAETSLDRDSRATALSRHLTPTGTGCVPDSDLAVAAWGTGAPVATQISAARADLTQEFDRADPKAIEKLAKLYLFLGMGHEARQVLIAFPAKVPNAQLLADIGTLLDGGTLGPQSPLHGMRDCDTQVALWSFLAAPTPEDVRQVDTSVVVRAFSGLPAELRHILARPLASRMSAIGAEDAARSVRNALARKIGTADREVGMLDAERALGEGRLPAAEAGLDRLAQGNDQIAAQAVLYGVTARLGQTKAPPAKLVEAAAALAFEKQGSPDGAAYAEAAILGQAALGNFDEAVATYRRWRDSQPKVDRAGVTAALLDLVIDRADDGRFLSIFFGEAEMVAALSPEAPVRLKLADRLAGLGFAQEARGVLGQDMGRSDAGLLLSAKVALALYQPQEAQAYLTGLEGADAMALRAEALTMAGDPRAAAPLLADLGQSDAAARTAWSGGDFAVAAAHSDRLKDAAAGLGLLSPQARKGAPGATLSGSKALLEDSAAVRQVLEGLLAAPVPVSPPATQAPTAQTSTSQIPKAQTPQAQAATGG